MSDESPSPPTESFTAALRIARERAVERGDPAIGPGHLVLGILGAGEGSGHAALVRTGIELDRIETKVASGASTKLSEVDAELTDDRLADISAGNVPLTAEAESIVADAQNEVVRMASDRMDTGHLLLALLRARDTAAAKALVDLGIDYDVIEHGL